MKLPVPVLVIAVDTHDLPGRREGRTTNGHDPAIENERLEQLRALG